MKVLLLDIGNTRLKWGIGEDGGIHQTGHLSQARIREQGIAALMGRLPRKVDAVAASNVASTTFATRLAGVVGAHTGKDVHFAQSARTACGVTNGYTQPRRLGVDRWLALVGAWTQIGSACLVVDAGTAVTIDALDAHGRHLGGQILPGTTLMSAALSSNTAGIPPAPPGKAGAFGGMELFARNTRSAVQSGVLGAVAGAIERAIGTLRTQQKEAVIVLTGGDATRILSALGEAPLHRPNLVLHGLLAVFETGGQRQ